MLLGDCLERLKELPDNSVDSVVTDPPYGLKFMGKKWDYDVPSRDVWMEVLRVCKPGAHLLSFGGARTYHRMVCVIEDAGFDIRDQLQWLYGSGFPKSHNLPGGIGTALKPANEPIVLARKPLSESTVARNVLKWGVGGLNIDASRIEASDQTALAKNWDRETISDMRGGNFMASKAGALPMTQSAPQGRWPANLLLDETAAEMLGVPARFFYCAKSSKAERNAGLEGMPEVVKPLMGEFKNNPGRETPKSSPTARANHHPTVKPLKLMEYLIKLVTPPGGAVLDPFMGSGSTGVAAFRLGFKFIGIEMNEEYVEIANKRIEHSKESVA